MELLIRNVLAVTMDEGRPVIPNAFIGVDGGRISYLSPHAPPVTPDRVIDGGGKLCMPGLINAHTHVSMTLMRGFADDYDLHTWLHEHVFPLEGRLTAHDVYVGAKLGMAEMLASGTVSITDMYMFLPAIARAADEMGLYANLSNGATSFDEPSYDFATDPVTLQMEDMRRDWHGHDGGRIRLDMAVHAEYTSFPKLWRANADYAASYGLNRHVHLSETRREHEECVARYGKTPAQMLCEHGVFDGRTTAAHCVYVTEEDMALLAAHGVTVAHNPVSNLKLGSGIAPVCALAAHGVNLALGTDGVCSNNNHDLFEEIKLAALLQKGVSGDPTVVPDRQALRMATVGGAYAQGRERELGMLREGYDASLILLDTARPSLNPLHEPHSALCYAARGGDVCLTMVRGRVLYEHGRFPHFDYERLRAEAAPVLARLFG